MSQSHKHYETAFKLEVARMVVDQGLSVTQVVNDMKIGSTAVRRWPYPHAICYISAMSLTISCQCSCTFAAQTASLAYPITQQAWRC